MARSTIIRGMCRSFIAFIVILHVHHGVQSSIKNTRAPKKWVTALAVYGTPFYDFSQTESRYVHVNAPKTHHLRIGFVGTSFEGLFPIVNTSSSPYGLRGAIKTHDAPLVYDALMIRHAHEPFTVYALVAEKVWLSPLCDEIIFVLNANACFHDASPITATDVAASIAFATRITTWQILKKGIKKIDVLSPTMLRVRFDPIRRSLKHNRIIYDRELPLVVSGLPIFKATELHRSYEKILSEPLTGSGPYRIKNVQLGAKITYEKHPDYWAKNHAVLKGFYHAERITVRYFTSDQAALLALYSNGVDVVVPAHERKDLAQTLKVVRFDRLHPLSLKGLALSQKNEALQNPSIRQAITALFDHAWVRSHLDYEYMHITDSFFYRSLFQATDHGPTAEEWAILRRFYSNAQSLYLEPIPPHEQSFRHHNQRVAKALQSCGWRLKEGAWYKNHQRLEWTICTSTTGRIREIVHFVERLRRCGIVVHLHILDNAHYRHVIKNRQYDLAEQTYYVAHTPGFEQLNYWCDADNVKGRNYAVVSHPCLSYLCEQLVEAPDLHHKTLYARCLDRVLRAERYVMPLLYQADEVMWMKPNVGFIKPSSMRGFSRPLFASFWVEAQQSKPSKS